MLARRASFRLVAVPGPAKELAGSVRCKVVVVPRGATFAIAVGALPRAPVRRRGVAAVAQGGDSDHLIRVLVVAEPIAASVVGGALLWKVRRRGRHRRPVEVDLNHAQSQSGLSLITENYYSKKR